MTPLFPKAFQETLFWVVFLAEVLVGSIIENRGARRSKRLREKAADKGTYLAANFALLSSFVAAIWFGYARIAVLPDWLFYPGLLIFLLGNLLSFWAIFILGRFYAPIVQVQADHRVVDSGPYSLIRHPVYSGGMLSYLGLGLALQSWAAVLVLLIGVGLGYAYRIRVEEKFLVAELEYEYVEYCKRTKRIIPFIF